MSKFTKKLFTVAIASLLLLGTIFQVPTGPVQAASQEVKGQLTDFVPSWVKEGGRSEMLKRMADPEQRLQIAKEIDEIVDEKVESPSDIRFPELGDTLGSWMTDFDTETNFDFETQPGQALFNFVNLDYNNKNTLHIDNFTVNDLDTGEAAFEYDFTGNDGESWDPELFGNDLHSYPSNPDAVRYSIENNVGKMEVDERRQGTSSTYGKLTPSMEDLENSEIRMRFKVDDIGSTQYLRVWIQSDKYSSGSSFAANGYGIALHLGNDTVTLQRRDNSNTTAIDSADANMTTGWHQLKLSAAHGKVGVSIWEDSEEEPEDWDIEYDIPEVSKKAMLSFANLDTENANSIFLDDLSVESPSGEKTYEYDFTGENGADWDVDAFEQLHAHPDAEETGPQYEMQPGQALFSFLNLNYNNGNTLHIDNFTVEDLDKGETAFESDFTGNDGDAWDPALYGDDLFAFPSDSVRYSIEDNIGKIEVDARKQGNGSAYGKLTPIMEDVENSELRMRFKVDDLGNTQYLRVWTQSDQYSSGSSFAANGYGIALHLGKDTLTLQRRDNSSTTSLGSAPAEMTTDWHWLKIRAADGKVGVSLWEDTEEEPEDWDIEYDVPKIDVPEGEASFSIQDNTGKVKLSKRKDFTVPYGKLVANMDSAMDGDMLVRFRPEQLGDDQWMKAFLRADKFLDGNSSPLNGYGMELNLKENKLRLLGVENKNTYQLGSADVDLTDDWHWMRLHVQGEELAVRIWKDGETEPDSWNLSEKINANVSAGESIMRLLVIRGNLETVYTTSEDPEVDKSALESKLAEIEAADLDENDYTEESWSAFATALAAAETAFNNADATQEEVNEALADLEAAYVDLDEVDTEPEVDKTALENRLKEIEDAELDENDYTAASWLDFSTALTAAEAIFDNAEATQTEVDEALAALNEAYDNLEELTAEVDKSLLERLLAEVEAAELDENDYTEFSWAIYTVALTAAEEAFNNDEATQEEVNEAFEALEAAYKGLDAIDPEPEVDKTALENKLAEIEAAELDESDYTEESWSDFATALAAAEEAFNSDEVTQEEVDAALAALATAYDELEKVSPEPEPVDKSALESKLQEIKDANLDENDYTEASWSNFAAALADAEAAFESVEVDQQEVDAALKTLERAYGDLKLKDPEPEPEPEADKSALKDKLQEIKAADLDENDYTEESWSALETAIANAEKVLGDAEATQEAVDEALTALERAYKALEEKTIDPEPEVDKSALENKLAEIKAADLDESNYTEESWSAFAKAVAKAEEVLEDAEATQAEVDDALANLLEAHDGLEKKSSSGDGGDKDKDKDKDSDKGKGGQEDPGKDGDKLPKTATNTYSLLLIAFGFIALGLVVYVIRKRKINSEN